MSLEAEVRKILKMHKPSGGTANLDGLDEEEWRRLFLSRIDDLREAVIAVARAVDQRKPM